MKKILFFAAVTLGISFAAPLMLIAQETPEGLRQAAFEDVKVALKLVDEAKALIAGPTSREKLQAAVNLYIQAGKLFEKSEVVLRSLGPQYASKDDVDNCASAKEECILAIQKLTAIINR